MRTKTATLIMQKQQHRNQQPKKDNKKVANDVKQSVERSPLKIHHLSHYDAFTLTVSEPSQQEQSGDNQLSHSKSSFRGHPEYCLLEQQNYRLIQSNHNLLVRFAATIQAIRNALKQVVVMIEEYHYVHAIQAIYSLLDRMRSIEPNENLQQTLKQRTSSIVEQYKPPPEPIPVSRRSSEPQFTPQVLEFVHRPAPIEESYNRFLHIREDQNDPEHPMILTPQFKPKRKAYRHEIWSQHQEPRHLMRVQSEEDEQNEQIEQYSVAQDKLFQTNPDIKWKDHSFQQRGNLYDITHRGDRKKMRNSTMTQFGLAGKRNHNRQKNNLIILNTDHHYHHESEKDDLMRMLWVQAATLQKTTLAYKNNC